MDKKRLLNGAFWIIFIGLLGVFAYTKGWILTNFESISSTEAHNLIQSNENVAILDVRTPQEYSQGHIEGAILAPVQTLQNDLAQIAKVKNQKIIVYCHSGNRSVAASRILVQNGFTPLNLKGGITDWKANGFATVQ